MALRLTEKQFARLQRARKSQSRRTTVAPLSRPESGIKWREDGFALSIPLRLASEVNRREHWARRHRRNKAQQAEVRAEWQCRVGRPEISFPCRVHLVQIGPEKLDSDNSTIAFKHVRDAIAALLGVDDGSDLITWTYGQERAAAHMIRIDVTFTNKENA